MASPTLGFLQASKTPFAEGKLVLPIPDKSRCIANLKSPGITSISKKAIRFEDNSLWGINSGFFNSMSIRVDNVLSKSILLNPPSPIANSFTI